MMYVDFNGGYSENASTCGNGAYVSKAYTGTTTTLYNVNGVEMRETVDTRTTYKLYLDGEYVNSFSDRKTAEGMFIDFAGITKATLKKLAK